MPETNQREYFQHPITGAEILRFIPKVSPFVITAVEQHHERQSGNGFPHKLKGKAINPFAEVIGLADEFATVIEKVGNGQLQENPLHAMARIIDRDFSPTMAQAFRKAFAAKRGA
jgi:HD-GYP domain-containing protein (c-di-GMP phosphodiesterase class II)